MSANGVNNFKLTVEYIWWGDTTVLKVWTRLKKEILDFAENVFITSLFLVISTQFDIPEGVP